MTEEIEKKIHCSVCKNELKNGDVWLRIGFYDDISIPTFGERFDKDLCINCVKQISCKDMMQK